MKANEWDQGPLYPRILYPEFTAVNRESVTLDQPREPQRSALPLQRPDREQEARGQLFLFGRKRRGL